MNELLVGLCVLLAVAVAVLAARQRNASDRDHRAQGNSESRLASQVSSLKLEKRRVDEILERMEEGVLVLNESFVPVMANRSARKLLRLQAQSLPPKLPSDEIMSVARRSMIDQKGNEEIIDVWPARTNLRVSAIPLENQAGIAIVLQDVTQELRTQHIRRQFVANASHELKSPVAGMQALAEAIREAVHDDARMAERFSEKLIAEAERLGRLISDLLDLSRLEDPANVSNRSTNLSQVAEHQVGAFEPTTKSKRMHVVSRVAPGVWVRGDDQQLGLMIRNLLDNAVRYTPEEGKVRIEVYVEDGNAVLKVRDTGIGIPLKSQARVFERFYRVDKDRSRDRGGTGLGLSIVKHVVELHAGHIGVESELGEGSTFTVRLPASVAPERSHVRSAAG